MQAVRARMEQISIHALCEEGDAILRAVWVPMFYFYPRPLRGGRRRKHHIEGLMLSISIHALCEEGDPIAVTRTHLPHIFLSTPSARRATTDPLGTVYNV